MNIETSVLQEPVPKKARAASFPVRKTASGSSCPSEAPDWLDRGQIPGLDGLRAIAVIMVMASHAVQSPGFPEWTWLRNLAHCGRYGVDIFFVISGFLITTLLAREMERTGHLNLQRFFARRFLRIIPAYLLLLVVVAGLQYSGKLQITARDWVGALTYTSNFLYHPCWDLGHTWSLAVEEHFYLLWPTVLFVGGILGGWRMACGCIVGCWAIRCVIAIILPQFLSHEDASFYTRMAENWTFTRLDTISMGCLLALASRSDIWRSRLNKSTSRWHLAGYFALICICVELARSTKFHLCVSYTVIGFCIAMLLWGAIRSEGLCRRVLANPILTTIGIGSYSIYLWQQIFIHPHQQGWIHEFPQNAILAFGAASLSFWLVERPCNQLKNRIAA